MTTLAAAPLAAVDVPDLRRSWALSPEGSVAVCTLLRSGRPAMLEIRRRAHRATVEVPGLSAHSQLLPADDARVLACHHYGGEHVVDHVAADGRTTELYRAGGRALWLLRGTPVVAVRPDADRSDVVNVLTGATLASVPGRAVSGVRLGPSAAALTVAGSGPGTRCLRVDLATGSFTSLLSVTRTSSDAVVDRVPATGTVVVSTTAAGPPRLGIGALDGIIRFPDVLSDPAGVAHLATSPDGRLVALSVERGLTSGVRVAEPATGTARDIPLPGPMVLTGRGHLDGRTLTLTVSTPTMPGTLLRVDLESGVTTVDDAPPPAAVSSLMVQGIECLVLGDIETAGHVAIALHGGPLESWRAAFDPLLAALSTAGVAVVAPNIRGSVGYGAAHTAALCGRWGDVDVADVLAVSARVRRLRAAGTRRPALIGVSYGAHLALTVAAREPHAVAALAPFLSGRRVLANGGPEADLIGRLGGVDAVDLRTLAGRYRAPVLILHGDRDDVIPAGESQLLTAAIRAAGGDVRLEIVRDTGHDLAGSRRRAHVLREVTDFMTADCQPNQSLTHRDDERRTTR